MECARQPKRRPLGNHAVRSHLALGADQRNLVADRRAHRFGQVVPKHDGRKFPAGLAMPLALRLERLHRTGRRRLQQVADREFLVGKNAFNQRAAVARAARHQHLLVQSGRCRGHVRHLPQPFQQRPPVANAVRLHAHQLHVRG